MESAEAILALVLKSPQVNSFLRGFMYASSSYRISASTFVTSFLTSLYGSACIVHPSRVIIIVSLAFESYAVHSASDIDGLPDVAKLAHAL